ncbi:copper homeostasis protein CutC [Clostridium folliculivorans]|uniref:PF03932 family protein CutC n=1 Tax=Clostridium folliculivorans TaxID=2886038 RepID=A0A9W5Y5D4_9CLOT|nr:copper homeostasis protein CutC [Clostridium folliculivorans]GKU27036.1 copper homeostasis protein CutC [Clostridium folliculivorans]GKU29122.1 copper homeostasis protein CutC [Clostridium folliculivorans]
MKNKMLIEVCCGSVDDAIEAERGGADRIELNSNVMYGGLTPSAGSILEAKERLSIPVVVMIRPREGGFCYTEEEFRVMEKDVKVALQCGADGIVFGILKEDGRIDVDRCKRIVELAGDKEVIFHRAIDVVPDVFEALDILIDLGVKRVLTKAQENTIEDGYELLMKMIDYCGDRLEILPGGIKIHNVEEYAPKLGCDQIHIASFIEQIDLSVKQKPHVFFGNASKNAEDKYNLINHEFVKKIRDVVDKI